jgi:hypothetical protein
MCALLRPREAPVEARGRRAGGVARGVSATDGTVCRDAGGGEAEQVEYAGRRRVETYTVARPPHTVQRACASCLRGGPVRASTRESDAGWCEAETGSWCASGVTCVYVCAVAFGRGPCDAVLMVLRLGAVDLCRCCNGVCHRVGGGALTPNRSFRTSEALASLSALSRVSSKAVRPFCVN